MQNSLLAPRNFAGVSSQGGATGGSGEGTVTKGPGRETPGDSSFGRRGTPSTALSRKRRGSSCGSSRGRACGYRPRTTWVLPAAAWRKGSETMTGEVPRRPTVGKPPYKSLTKLGWRSGGEEKAALAASSLGMAAEPE